MEQRTTSSAWMIVLGLLLCGGLFFLVGTRAERGSSLRIDSEEGLHVTGTGVVTATPETGSITIGVQEQGETAAEVQQKGARIGNAIRRVLEQASIDEEDIETEGYNVSPRYSYQNSQREVAGYEGVQTFRVRIRNLDQAGDVISRATEAGANTVSNLQFTLDTQERLEKRQEARLKAIEQAREQAEELADAAGMRLGDVLLIQDTGSNQGLYSDTSANVVSDVSAGAAESPVIEASEQDITATVEMRFELK